MVAIVNPCFTFISLQQSLTSLYSLNLILEGLSLCPKEYKVLHYSIFLALRDFKSKQQLGMCPPFLQISPKAMST